MPDQSWKKTRHSLAAAALIAVGLTAFCPPAGAADTVETWDVGATDVDFYIGFDGAGRNRRSCALWGDLMLGFGLAERLSAYLGATVSADANLSQAMTQVYLGLFGTPVDTAHFDLDLFLDLRASGVDESDLAVTPSVELNFDVDPEQQSWGAYVQVGFPIFGRAVTQAGEEVDREVAGDIEATVGNYVTIAERHQLLLAYDMTFRPRPVAGEHAVEVGGVALGYNVAVHEAIELIAEARLNIPQGDERWCAGFILGLIATMPSAARPESIDGLE